MSEEQMIYIIKNNLINQCNEQQKREIFNFAFGEKFMKSKDKGEIKTYEENINGV